MARQTVNLGTGINTGTGDTLRVAMDKVNDNTEELYNAVFGTDSANTVINVSQISTEVTNGSITLTPNGTGQVVVEADLIVDNVIKSNNSSMIDVQDTLRVTGGLITNNIAPEDSSYVQIPSLDVDVLTNSSSTAIQVTEGLNVSGTLYAATIDVTNISSGDSTGVTINDNLLITGTLKAEGSTFLNIEDNTNISGTLQVDEIVGNDSSAVQIQNIDTSVISASDSTGVTLNDDLHIGGTIRPADSSVVNVAGGIELIGNLNIHGDITSTGSRDITIEPGGTGDILLKCGGQVGIGDVSSPDTSLHIKQANAVLTLQRTADTGTPGIDFQQAGGNVRAQIYMDGTNGISKELIFKVQDGSLDERFRVTKSGASVTGTFNIMSDTDSTLSDATISMNENEITTLRSNDNLVLSANGTGTVQTTSNVHLLSATPIIQIQRTDNANVPGISFLGDGGTEGGSIKFDGTSGTTNEIILSSFFSGAVTERLRVTTTGAKVTGTLEVDEITGADSSAIQINNLDTDVISSSSSSAIQVTEGLNVSGTLSADTIDTNTISSTDSSEVLIDDALGISGSLDVGGDLQANTMSSRDSSEIRINDNVSISSNLTVDGSLDVNDINSADSGAVVINDSLQINGILSAVDSTALTVQDGLEVNGSLTVAGGDTTTADLVVTGELSTNSIKSDDSTGVVINDELRINGNISAVDSTALVVQDGLDVNGALTVTGELSINSIKSDDSSAVVINDSLQINGILSAVDSTALVVQDGLDVNGALTVAGGDTTTADLVVTGELSTNSIKSDDSSAVVINDSLQINGILSAVDSTALTIQDGLEVNGALTVDGAATVTGTTTAVAITASGTVTHNAATVYGVQDDLATSTTALALTKTIHSLAGGETDYTLAAGTEGQIMHFVVAGGTSTANEIALTEITVSQVRNPRDGERLATYVWRPFIAGTTDLGDSTVPQRTMATCIFANNAWNLDFFTQA